MNQEVNVERSKFSRRNMILALGGAFAAAGVLIAAPFKNPIIGNVRRLAAFTAGNRGRVSLGDAGYDEWVQQVGSVFTIAGGTRLQLAGVRPLASGGSRPASLGRNSAFLAVFDAIGGATVAGDLIYGASHPQYGAMMIFLTASSDPRTPARMFALFN
jgi:hypothetical protein